MKFYTYILKSEDEIYAYTTDKKMAKRFENERNMKLFEKSKFHIESDAERELFFENNRYNELIDIRLQNKDGEMYNVVGTIEENLYMDNLINQFMNTIKDHTDIVLSEYSHYLTRETINDLLVLADSIDSDSVRFDTYKMFTKMF